ncbi:hypothetical protein SADUNF_Sadunf04G0000100 [Salix dunnii]|uniref:Uncharacterized protein n=1 Tax=Salix dunnii TaxID=1413687 RepID=A0A835KE20_9ROSI|nr:hypothetical protein SADUNF_Sadunf04G0000100 [Salix dunnii]
MDFMLEILNTKQVISDAQATKKVRDDELPDINSDESEGSDESYNFEGLDESYGSNYLDESDESSSSVIDSSLENSSYAFFMLGILGHCR